MSFLINCLSAFFLALTLSADDLSVGIAYGLSKKRVSLKSLLIMLAGSAVAAYGIMAFSNFIFVSIPENIAKYIMVAILGIIGIKMLYNGWKEKDKSAETEEVEKVIKSNNSDSNLEKFMLGIGLGIGDFAEAIAMSLLGIPIILAVLLLQVALVINISVGNLIAYQGFARKISGKLSLLPGIILILFAVYELFF